MSDSSKSQVEQTVEYLARSLLRYRLAIFWGMFLVFVFWIMSAVKEVSALLMLSYFIALLLDPIVSNLERKGVSRGLAVVFLSLVVFLSVIVFIAFAVPELISQYSLFVELLPGYFKALVQNIDALSQHWFHVSIPLNPDELWNDLKNWSSLIGVEHLKTIAINVGNTLLSGYSLTLTIFNFTLLPFFVYYLTCDLRKIHAYVKALLKPSWREQIETVGGEILTHIHVFFRGQFTVACVLVILYVSGLLLIGLPSGVIIGILSGALSVVPYLGVSVGLFLSVLITLVTNPGWWALLKVLIVFGVVQTLEGTVLTPRIVGESLGIPPLGVMLTLIVAGQLFGLIGLVIAIPAAASFRVLFRHVLSELQATQVQDSKLIVARE